MLCGVMAIKNLNSISKKHQQLQLGRDHFVNAPNQWETTLLCNVVSYWLGVFTKWSLLWASNLNKLKTLYLYKIHISQHMDKILMWNFKCLLNFTQIILPKHCKIWFAYKVGILKSCNFSNKSCKSVSHSSWLIIYIYEEKNKSIQVKITSQ